MLTKVFWLYGRSGAGKTTLAKRLLNGMADRQIPVSCLDGDEMREGLCSDLEFTSEARIENHRRIAEVAKLMAERGLNVIVATMAPEHVQRDVVAKVLGQRLVWFLIHAPLGVCIQRDPKGLYRRAKIGEMQNLLDFPFDTPRPHENKYCIDTVTQNVEGCYQSILGIAQEQLSDFAI
jgi:adenylylsulfate kinase-like enzyme